MIKSFRCVDTQNIYENKRVVRFDGFRALIEKRLDRLDNATSLQELASLSSNHLKKLCGTRTGQHSIRVDSQYCLCFSWADDGPQDVEIVDIEECQFAK